MTNDFSKNKYMKKAKEIIKQSIPDTILTHKLGKIYSQSILFTFDDGPDQTITPQIIDILTEYRVCAVFFVVGAKADKYPHLVEQIIESGHIIGNHTYHHPNTHISFRDLLREIKKCQDIINSICGVNPVLFRPPRGIVSHQMLLGACLYNLRTVLWSNEGGEWGYASEDDEDTIGSRLSSSLRPQDIVLLHDNNHKVPNILKNVLRSSHSRNVDFRNGIGYLTM